MRRSVHCHISFFSGAALALAACAAPASAPTAAPAVEAGAPISADGMHSRIAFLASDELRGRDTPSEGLEAAAAYLAREAQLLGLEPAGNDNSYFQRWPYPLRRVAVERTGITVTGPRGPERLQYGQDFFATGGTAADIEGPLVFLGAEIPESGAEGALRDRIALVALPGSLGQPWNQQRARQLARAQQQGARAVIHILDPGFPQAQLREVAQRLGRPERVFGGEVGYTSFMLSYEAARRLFTAASLSLDESWRRAVGGPSPALELPGVTALAGVPLEVLDDAYPPNVVAVLRGSDPELRNEYVVVSAHMDHVGVGQPVNGDSIYNGADDNASGTAGILEVARAMAALPTAPRRSVLFLWVSGEEKGLLGSRWFSDHPTVPIEQIVANINVDMIASDRHRDSVVVIGKDYSTLGELVNRVNAARPELGLVASDDIWPEERFFFRSDHFNFARREVPAIFFFTGVHQCYHRPCDTIDFIDTPKAARVASLIFFTALEIANAPARPAWDPAGLREVRALTR